jgi:hypothetical protein
MDWQIFWWIGVVLFSLLLLIDQVQGISLL